MKSKLLWWCLLLVVPCAALADDAFTPAAPGYRWSFPRDHGGHAGYQTEWWYFTGLLFTGDAEPFGAMPQFGFELTFFRRARAAGDASPVVWLAHAALTDIARGHYAHAARITPGGLSVAGADAARLNVWNTDWRVESFGNDIVLEHSLEMDGKPRTLRLILKNPRVVLNGEAGYSKKGSCPACASLYYSMPALSADGVLTGGGREERVHGLVWMDHEFMTNSLQEDQRGWDWFGLALKDGRRLMLLILRGKDGGISVASGTVSSAEGTRELSAADFRVTALAHWESPHTKAVYPSSWRVEVPKEGISAEIAALTADQEFTAGDAAQGVSYWEGAVRSKAGDVLGYAELTGYAESLSGNL